MMDPARAAPVLNLDAKPQAKSANDGNKAEAGDRKIKFQDTLNRHIPSKGQQALQGDQDSDMLSTSVDGDAPLQADDASDASATATGPVTRFKKPIILLANVLQKTGSDEQDNAEALPKDRLDLRSMGKASEKTRLKDDGDTYTASEPDVDIDALADLKPGDEVASPVNGKTLRRDAKTIDDADAPQTTDDKAAPKTEPVKDVLSLLHGKAEQAAQAGAHAQDMKSMPDTPVDTVSGAEGQGEGGTVYRISRADGKGGAIDIPATDRPLETDKQVPETVVNPVTVMDQRRYLAPAQDNALAVVNTIGNNHEWVSAMQPDSSLANAAAMAGSGKVVNTLKIQMHPIELGLVTATMRLQGEELSVELKVETGAAYRQLKDDQSRIVEALKAQGFSVDQVSVVMAPERTDSGNGQSSTMQNGQSSAFAQQNQARGGAQEQASSGRGNGGYQQETGRNDNSFADDGRSEVGIAGGRGAAGTGQDRKSVV